VSSCSEPKGIVVDNGMFTDHPELDREQPVAILASPEDLEQVQRNPLVRARATLNYALSLDPDQEALKSTWLTLGYVYLAFQEYDSALEMAKNVLKSPEPVAPADEVTRLSHKRMIATARMYAAEASCALGETMNAMKFLVGDGQDDAFDRLASDLGGVTLETASTNGKGKRRLARAQTMVRSSASGVTAAMGNLTAAKQLAMSAQAMEDAYASNRERSSARRALIYTLLRGGHHGPALSLLRSLR
jgi:tetratricopeptide (TPR) repeat protein